VRGITSRVDIIWRTGNTTVRRVDNVSANIVSNSAVYTDQLITPPLSVNDSGRVYICEVRINTTFVVNSAGGIVLDFIGKQCMVTYVHINIRTYVCIHAFWNKICMYMV